jgi:hypothetical protein
MDRRAFWSVLVFPEAVGSLRACRRCVLAEHKAFERSRSAHKNLTRDRITWPGFSWASSPTRP